MRLVAGCHQSPQYVAQLGQIQQLLLNEGQLRNRERAIFCASPFGVEFYETLYFFE